MSKVPFAMCRHGREGLLFRTKIIRNVFAAYDVYGRRDLVVDYAPVVLGGETFWMPSTIGMHVTTGAGTFHQTRWSFLATYRNYHKLQVSSRIIPSTP